MPLDTTTAEATKLRRRIITTRPNVDWIIGDVKDEIGYQDALWGGPDRTLASQVYLSVLVEEVGEVGRAILHRDLAEEERELLQVAAVAIQAVLSIRLRRQGKAPKVEAW